MIALSTRLQEAIEALKKNRADDSAWKLLYDNLWPYAYAIAFRILGGDRSGSEDVCQNAFLRTLDYIDFNKLNGPDEVVRYFSKVVHNAAMDYLKSQKEIPAGSMVLEHDDQRLGDNEPTEVRTAHDYLAQERGLSALRQLEARESLLELSGKLNKRERQLAIMVGLGYTLEEVAARLGTTYSNAGVQVHRLRVKLQKFLIDKNK